MNMQRRHFLFALGAGLPGLRAIASEPVDRVALGAAWRGASADDPQQVGVLDIDWCARTVTPRWTRRIDGRAHGLTAEPDGSLLAVAMRPGTWLARLDAEGRVMQRITIADENPHRRFDGHTLASADGQWLFSGETDTRDGSGWLSVREHATLRKVDEWRSGGVDPHEMLLDDAGQLLVVNGGILRSPDGRKRDLDSMDSALVRLDTRSGRELGRWQLTDRRLSLRHVAWNAPQPGTRRLLGIALQAEHDEPARRAQAPVLAVWDGERLAVPTQAADATGYAGDISAAPGGGFVLSGQKANRAVLWQPDAPAALTRVAELTDPCALAAWGAHDGAVLVAGARGVGRWHPKQPGAMLPWPQPMALDNHWVVMG
jgi:hypothetical protein